MNRKPKALFVTIALALAGTLLLVGYVRTAAAGGSSANDLVPVLVVKSKIAAGTPASKLDQLVTTQRVPAKAAAHDGVITLAGLKGQVASIDLFPGEQLVRSRFVPATELHHAAAPDGLLEVTVALDPVRALGGALVAGQNVAVLASFDASGSNLPTTALLLHNVKVTRVEATAAMPKQDANPTAVQLAPTSTLLITVAVNPDAAVKVVYAAEHGHLWLSAEPANGTSSSGVAPS